MRAESKPNGGMRQLTTVMEFIAIGYGNLNANHARL